MISFLVITLALALILCALGRVTERKVSEADLFLARLTDRQEAT